MDVAAIVQGVKNKLVLRLSNNSVSYVTEMVQNNMVQASYVEK